MFQTAILRTHLTPYRLRATVAPSRVPLPPYRPRRVAAMITLRRRGLQENDFHPQSLDIHFHLKCKFVRGMRTSGNENFLIEEGVWNGAGTGTRALFIHFSAVSIRSKPNPRFQVLCFLCINKRRICPNRCVTASSPTRIVSRIRQIVASTSSEILFVITCLSTVITFQIKNAV